MSAECRRLRGREDTGPACSCSAGACALDIDSAATTEPRDNPTVRGRILSVSFPLSQTGDERDVQIEGYGLSPLVGDDIDWANQEGTWRGTVERIELQGESRWLAWGSVRRV